MLNHLHGYISGRQQIWTCWKFVGWTVKREKRMVMMYVVGGCDDDDRVWSAEERCAGVIIREVTEQR